MPKQCALAAAAPAHNNERLASINAKRNIVEDRAIPEFPNEVDHFDEGRVRGWGHGEKYDE